MAISDDPAQSHDDVVIHSLHRDWALGEYGPCLIVIWRGKVTEEALLVINAQIWSSTQARPGQVAYINVIEPNSPPPSAPLRKLVMEGLSRPGKALNCKSAVVEGNEFRSALVRAVMTGLALLRPQEIPTKFFKNLPELAVWLQAQMRTGGVEVDDNGIVRACEYIRSKMPT